MRFLGCFAITLMCIVAHAAPIETLKVTGRMTQAARDDLRRRLQAAGGCNANVCFAIDGSGSITETEFENQKNFVLDVITVIAVDDAAEVAAGQYASSVTPISPLTPDTAKFNLAVNATRQVGGASFVVGGVNYCFSQLFRRLGEANKIVLLGDGRSNIGSSAIRRANLFRRIGGSVCTVAAGFPDDKQLLGISGGDPNLVFQVDSFLDVLALQAIVESLVLGICGLS